VLLCTSWAQKYSSWILNTYTFTAQIWRFLREKNSKIASLTSCQRPDLWKTLKYSQSRDLEGIQWILWIYTDAAPALQTLYVLQLGDKRSISSTITRGIVMGTGLTWSNNNNNNNNNNICFNLALQCYLVTQELYWREPPGSLAIGHWNINIFLSLTNVLTFSSLGSTYRG